VVPGISRLAGADRRRALLVVVGEPVGQACADHCGRSRPALGAASRSPDRRGICRIRRSTRPIDSAPRRTSTRGCA